MAKYKGILWSDARGKMNGVVFSRNTFGTYIRNLASPVQPRTPAQLNIRAILQNLSRRWRTLTAAQQAAWNALAQQVVLTDTLGNPYHPTGQQLYCGLNANLELDQSSAIDNAPPAPVLVPTPQTVTVTATGGATPSLTVAWTGGDANFDAFIYATPTISEGRTFIRPSEFRLIATAQSGAGTPALNILTQWQAKYGAPPNPADGQVAIAVKLVDPNTGFAGQIVYGRDAW
jgi:hypothetical protein